MEDDAMPQAGELLRQAIDLLEPRLGALTDHERTHLAPVPDGVLEAIAAMLAQTELLARLAPACPGFDAAEVEADLQDAHQVALLANRVAYLTRLIGDAQRSRISRAYQKALVVYNVARSGARQDATLLPLVEPLREVYANKKKPAKKGS